MQAYRYCDVSGNTQIVNVTLSSGDCNFDSEYYIGTTYVIKSLLTLTFTLSSSIPQALRVWYSYDYTYTLNGTLEYTDTITDSALIPAGVTTFQKVVTCNLRSTVSDAEGDLPPIQ